jgi:uncharacterized protein with HEPN domain
LRKQDDTLRLQHILDYGNEVISFTDGSSLSDLEDDLVLERALSYSIGVIGEAASRLTPEFRAKTSYIPWSDIISMRNFLFHAYFQVDHKILWDTATVSIPELLKQLEEFI